MDSSGIKNEPDTGIQLMADPQMPNPLLQPRYSRLNMALQRPVDTSADGSPGSLLRPMRSGSLTGSGSAKPFLRVNSLDQKPFSKEDPFNQSLQDIKQDEKKNTAEYKRAINQAWKRQRHLARAQLVILQNEEGGVNGSPPPSPGVPGRRRDAHSSTNILRTERNMKTILLNKNNSNKKSMQLSPSHTKGELGDVEGDDDNADLYNDLDLDESFVDLDKGRAKGKLDYDKVVKFVDENSARKERGEPYTCGEACCTLDAGYHCCGETSARSDLEKHGVGIVLYFKFIKTLIFYFIIFTVMSVPALFYSISAYSNYNRDTTTNINRYFLSTTVGSLGLGATTCALGRAPSATADPTEQELYLSCVSGTLGTTKDLVYGLVSESSGTCNLIDIGLVDTSCDLATSSAFTTAWANCEGQTECTITIEDDFFNTSSSSCSSQISSNNVYMKVYCNDDDLQIGRNDYVSKRTIAIVLASLDAAIIVIYVIMVLSLKRSIHKATRNVLRYSYSPKLFTIAITNLPSLTHDELYHRLWKYINNRMNDEQTSKHYGIVDIQLATSSKILDLQVHIADMAHKKSNMVKDFISEFFPSMDTHKLSYSGVCELMFKLQQPNPKVTPKILRKAEKQFKMIQKLHHTKRRLVDEMNIKFNSQTNRVYAAFVTFETMQGRDIAVEKIGHTSMARFLDSAFGCCKKRTSEKYFEGKLLKAVYADDPSNVLWSNLEKSKFEKFSRRFVSLAITVALFVATAIILVISTNYKTEFYKKYPTIDCTGKSPTMAEVSIDYNLGDLATGLLQCYCEADITNRLNDVFADSNGDKLCLTWLQDKALTYTLTLAIVFGVLCINYIMQYLYSRLSKFEKHKSLTEQLGSRVMKVFIAQFLNTGVLILILNARFKHENWFFRGQYSDMTSLWYQNIGATLLTTMTINVFTYPGLKIVFYMIRKLSRCWDRRCGFDPHITRQKTQKKYQNLYLGPQFLLDYRYSQILTLVFICFLYSAGLPLLFVTTLVQLIISFYIDRYLLLKVARKPESYDEELELKVQSVMMYISFVHIVFAIWIYGNSEIFSKESAGIFDAAKNLITSQQDNVGYRFFIRATYTHNIVLLVLGIIILAYLIIDMFLIKFIMIMLSFCRKGNSAKIADENTLAKEGKRRSDKRSMSRIVHDSAKYYDLISVDNMNELIVLNQFASMMTNKEEYKMYLQLKIDRLKTEKTKRQTLEAQGIEKQRKETLIGTYNYNIRLHPTYKDLFPIEDMMVESLAELEKIGYKPITNSSKIIYSSLLT